MRHFLIILTTLFFKLSFSQNDSLRVFKNVIETGATANIVPNFNTLAFNGWGDSKFHTSIIAYSYKRYIKPDIYIGVDFSYLWTLSSDVDFSQYPQQTNIIGRNLTLDFGKRLNSNSIPRLSFTGSAKVGVQDVKEKSVVYYKPEYYHVYFEDVGTVGLLTGASISVDYQIFSRLSVGVSTSMYRRIGFKELTSYYDETNRDFNHNFILIQPKIGIHL